MSALDGRKGTSQWRNPLSTAWASLVDAVYELPFFGIIGARTKGTTEYSGSCRLQGCVHSLAYVSCWLSYTSMQILSQLLDVWTLIGFGDAFNSLTRTAHWVCFHGPDTARLARRRAGKRKYVRWMEEFGNASRQVSLAFLVSLQSNSYQRITKFSRLLGMAA
jgi:hypothetical protein